MLYSALLLKYYKIKVFAMCTFSHWKLSFKTFINTGNYYHIAYHNAIRNAQTTTRENGTISLIYFTFYFYITFLLL